MNGFILKYDKLCIKDFHTMFLTYFFYVCTMLLGSFSWADGTQLNYTNWILNEPNGLNRGENCGEYKFASGMYAWNDAPCSVEKPFLCKRMGESNFFN